MTTGESKTLEIFYRDDAIVVFMARLIVAYKLRHGEYPVLGGIHSKYKTMLTTYEPLGCGGYDLRGVHWHIVHIDYSDIHNITEMFVCNEDCSKIEGV